MHFDIAIIGYGPVGAVAANMFGASGHNVEKALDVLSFSKKKGAKLIKKLLDSAISNAENNENADIDDLKIKSIIVNKGLVMKRIKIRARGRADRITKPMCHIEIKLSNKVQEAENGTES